MFIWNENSTRNQKNKPTVYEREPNARECFTEKKQKNEQNEPINVNKGRQ